jgi:hypothetical protein
MKKLAVLIFATIASAVPALAETSTPQPDPNEVICRTQRITGSRVGMSRRCATRAQWLEDERQQRAQFNERTLRQTNPQALSAAERAFANGRSVNVGGSPVPN